MPVITREGRPPMHTLGELPKVGTQAPDFVLTDTSMLPVSLEKFKGKKVILNIFPSADTPTCERSIRKFNEEAASIPNTVVLCVSMDTPFAHKRFCAANGIANVVSLSATTQPEFGRNYGVRIEDGYLKGYFARAIVALNEEGIVIHNELVSELTQEPNYKTCIEIVKAEKLVSSVTKSGVVTELDRIGGEETKSLAEAFSAASSKFSAKSESEEVSSPDSTTSAQQLILPVYGWEGTDSPYRSEPIPEGMTNHFDVYGNRLTVAEYEAGQNGFNIS